MTANVATHSPLTWRNAFFLTVLFSLLLFVPLLFGRCLESGDETRVAGIAAEMVITNEWWIPRLNGVNFLEYPPLFYWCAGGLFKIFGITDAAARLTAMLFAVGGMLLTLQLARKLRYSPVMGLAAALMMGVSAQYFGNARKCMVDIGLAFFILLTVTAYISYLRSFSRPRKALWLILTAIGFAGGILTKGILGAGLPAVILGGTRVLNDVFVSRKISWSRYFALAAAFFLGAGAAGLYYLHFYLDKSPASQAIFHELFFVNNFGRFSGSQGDHVEGLGYYFIKLPTLFAPFIPFTLIGLYGILRNVRHRREMFLAAALMLPFLLFCAASSKRVVYLLPLTPFAALITVWFGKYQLSKFKKIPRRISTRQIAVFTVVLALGLMLGNKILNVFMPDESQAELFAKCRKLEAEGCRIELADAHERTRGGAVFYLHRTVPTVSSKSEQQPGTVRVYRTKEEIPGAENFPDRHKIVVKCGKQP